MAEQEKIFRIRLKEGPDRVMPVGKDALTRTVFNLSELMLHDLKFILVKVGGESRLALPGSGHLTVRAAHEETGISRSTLRRLSRTGKLKARKVRGKWLIRRDSLEEYLMARGRSIKIPAH